MLTWQLNSLIFPFSMYQKSAHGTSSLALVGWITPPGQLNGPVKVPWIASSTVMAY
jgi:hypothetical protein